MNDQMLTSLYCFAAVFLSLGGLCIVMKLLASPRRRDSHEEREIDPRFVEEWLEPPPRRQAPLAPPMLPQTDAEYFLAAPEARERDLPVPLPPARTGERETW